MSKRDERRANWSAYLTEKWREDDVRKSQKRRGVPKDNKVLKYQMDRTDAAYNKLPWWRR